MKLDGIYADTLVQKIIDNVSTPDQKITQKRAVDVAMRYIEVVIAELATNYHRRTEYDRKLDLHNVSLNALRNKIGKFGPRGKQQYWWDYLHKLSPIINIVEKGNNMSMALTKVQAMFENDWEEAAVWTINEDYKAKPDDYEMAIIDLISLGNWMLQAPDFYKHKPTLETVMKQAERIFAIAEQFRINEQFGQLPMLKRPAASGRMYYGGVNLQNCSSAVRHAALGRHYSYDLRTSVFAWQISELRTQQGLDSNTNPPNTIYTRELIAAKQIVRERFRECFKDSLYSETQIDSKIKEAITAIGFGCRRSGGFNNSQGEFIPKGLRGIIGDKSSRDAFLNHPWIKGFMKEQDAIITEITDYWLKENPAHKTAEYTQSRGSYSKKVFASYLYQYFESCAIRDIMKLCAEKEILLWVHDGFCTRHPINIADANFILKQDHGSMMQLEKTFHKGWADPDQIKLTPEEQRIVNEQQEREERAQRNQAELAHWASKGYNTTGMHSQTITKFKFKTIKEEGYYSGI